MNPEKNLFRARGELRALALVNIVRDDKLAAGWGMILLLIMEGTWGWMCFYK